MTNPQIKLTIAIPSIPSRKRQFLQPMYAKLMSQIGDIKDVEVLSIMDNKTMSIGRKRSLLFKIAQGKYTCIIDDDDDVSDDFVDTLRFIINDQLDVDVISYDQEAVISGKSWLIRSSLKHDCNPPFMQLATDPNGNPLPCDRPPWHWCAWRTDFAREFSFGDVNWGEDGVFVAAASKAAFTEYRLEKVMCKYLWSPTVSQAPQPTNYRGMENIPLVKV